MKTVRFSNLNEIRYYRDDEIISKVDYSKYIFGLIIILYLGYRILTHIFDKNIQK